MGRSEARSLPSDIDEKSLYEELQGNGILVGVAYAASLIRLK